jgi:RND family efflux transporter MFP subunit
MDSREDLVGHLRIDRDPVRPGGSAVRALVALALVIVTSLGTAWVLGWRPFGHRTPAVPSEAVVVAASTDSHPADARASLIDASGYVVARRSATVASKLTGRLVAVLIEEAQTVEEGSVMARIDDSTLQAGLKQARMQQAQAEATLSAAEVAVTDATPIFERNRQQANAGLISAQAFDQARGAYNALVADRVVRQRARDVARSTVLVTVRNLEDSIVRAPFTGVVTARAAQVGEIVSPVSAGGGFTRTGIGTLVDMTSLEVEVDVAENFIAQVFPDQEVSVTLNAYPDAPMPARVIAVIPSADRAKATVKVRVGFTSPDERVLPDMGVRVAFLRPKTSTPEKK